MYKGDLGSVLQTEATELGGGQGGRNAKEKDRNEEQLISIWPKEMLECGAFVLTGERHREERLKRWVQNSMVGWLEIQLQNSGRW